MVKSSTQVTLCCYRYVAIGPIAPETDLAEQCLHSWWCHLLYVDTFVYDCNQVGRRLCINLKMRFVYSLV